MAQPNTTTSKVTRSLMERVGDPVAVVPPPLLAFVAEGVGAACAEVAERKASTNTSASLLTTVACMRVMG